MTVLLADDHAIIREGLKIYIKNIIPGCAFEEAFTGIEALEKIRLYEYDLIILDIIMPATDPAALVSNILLSKPWSKILIFSMNSEEVHARKYLNLGALGYLNKDAGIEEMRQAIDNVMNNKRYLSPSLTQSLMESALGNKAGNQNPFELLSPREIEITKQLMKGKSVSQIGELLRLHTSTVGTHKARIFEKLACKNLVELNELAIVHHFQSG